METSERLELARDLVLAVMRSASTERIRPQDWWARAKSALETGASVAQDFGSLVSTMGEKLQIDTPTTETALALRDVRDKLGDDFEPFRRLCETQALYIVALAQERRTQQRELRFSENPNPEEV